MLSEILALIFEHPLLGFVMLLDLIIIFVILSYILSRLFQKHKPIQKFLFFVQKLRMRMHPEEIRRIEDLYSFVIDAYVKKGVLSPEDGSGFRAREKILASISGKERDIVEKIFDYYEVKKYGGGIGDEERVVISLLNAFRSI